MTEAVKERHHTTTDLGQRFFFFFYLNREGGGGGGGGDLAELVSLNSWQMRNCLDISYFLLPGCILREST